MPRKLELEALEAELAAVAALLDEAKTLSDPVGVVQYQQRRQELEQEIEGLRDGEVHPASVALYFGGKPVLGSRGIAADFAGKALEHFQEIISKQFATDELGALGERGRIPLKPLTSLMVTGVTQGSFGFLLDELDEQTQMFDTALKQVVSESMAVIESAGSADENAFEQAAEALDGRTLAALKDFFVHLDATEATLRLVDDKRDLSLDRDAVHRARVRTEATKIDEEDKDVTGVLLGFLPKERRFELQLPSGETICGTATKEATEQYVHTMEGGKPAVWKQCSAKVKERTVKPIDRAPRLVYRLLEFSALGQE